MRLFPERRGDLVGPQARLHGVGSEHHEHVAPGGHAGHAVDAEPGGKGEPNEKLDVGAVFNHVMENKRGALVQNGRVLLTRELALESTREGFVGVRKVKYTIGQEHVTLLTKDLALVVSDGQSHFELDDGRWFDTPFAQSVVLKRVAGVWKVLHAHRSFPVKL